MKIQYCDDTVNYVNKIFVFRVIIIICPIINDEEEEVRE